jgi:alanyl-tRNA synthetase/REP element-mobilizing transposase RayT
LIGFMILGEHDDVDTLTFPFGNVRCLRQFDFPMTSAEIRQSFLDFFREKQHSIVPSASLLPDSPNLLFTNAGMNQFVPIFLGQQKPPWNPPRVADTQKCIRAGGKHNDLEDVGLDTYHHTFFEMLGNWSFGDYFKKEAIEWAWELVIERWKLPPQRLYATVYKPGPNEPSEFDQEAHDHWARLFQKAGLDPAIHIVNGNKKDNFWMMGDTGPCGPCSELHIDLTPAGDTKGSLVNAGDARCIEIWNLVFIQFNANADSTFSPLPQRHVDTGMGFERITAMIQGTNGFTDFSHPISNYETDIFRPIFDELETLSGKHYGSTLPKSGSTGDNDQEKIDVAFRVIADHIRTLGFAIADGIQPSNEGRGYVLRRVLRRAVRYGRTLGFREPFFYELVDVLVGTLSDVFSELAAKQIMIKETLRREEEGFNKTLDKGIALFESEVERRLGSARDSRAISGDSPETSSTQTRYSKRRLPHFERPWGKYAVTFITRDRRPITPAERDIVLDCILFPARRNHYQLYAACVMPDHVHLLFEPQIKGNDAKGSPVFYSLPELLQNIKSVSAHRLNTRRGDSGTVWEKESFDRLIRSESDLREKFVYICKNPWTAGVVSPREDYPWLWTGEEETPSRSSSGESPDEARESRALPSISGSFAFRLYDEQGFPLDLTELMARERGLTVDVAGFEQLMEEQRARARAAQKKEVISVSDDNLQVAPTKFLGYDFLETEAVVEAVTPGKQVGELNVVLDRTSCYAEMGGQVGDHGLLHVPGHDRTEVGQLAVLDTQKRGDVFIHRAKLTDGRAPEVGEAVRLSVDVARRSAIQGHHTVTHLLHWALHELVSRTAAQKGSYVGPDKLTFDFSSAALTAQQRRGVEKLVNEKIREGAPVSWTEIPYADAKKRSDVQQFFGDKYGDVVRVVQIGGEPKALNGYSMELCGGTHVRATGEIGSFRIVREEAIAAGIRRIEAVAGEAARDWAKQEAERQQEKFEMLARKKSGIAGLPEFEDDSETNAMLAQIDACSAHLEKLEVEVHDWEKQHAKASEADLRNRAGTIAHELAATHAEKRSCVAEVPDADAKLLRAVVDALKPKIGGPIFLAGASDGRVALVASVPKELTSKIQANRLIQEIAPIVGGKGGGRPENAQGAGKDATKISEALARARELVSM